MPDKTVTRVTMEHSDGSSQTLEGDEAQEWYDWVNSYLLVGQLRSRGPGHPGFNWKWTGVGITPAKE
jgi:hypothetical protein